MSALEIHGSARTLDFFGGSFHFDEVSEVGQVLSTHTPELFKAAVARAAAFLQAGEVVGVPTETVYGLAANALDESAVAKIFRIKGRPANNPIIVHVADRAMARSCAREWPERAAQLTSSFWPGPLTIVLPRSEEIPAVVTAGGSTVGIRWPSHPFMQALILACGFPLAAPSANRSNELSPTTAEHVRKSLGNDVRLIVDGGPAHIGIESTVVDLSVAPPQLLRPGMIHAESILAVVGELQTGGSVAEGELRSPGMLSQHYAPKAKLELWRWQNERELRARIERLGFPLHQVHVIAHARIPLALDDVSVCVIPHDAEAFARAIYAELHRCDEAGASAIVLEAPPDEPAWAGILDRLRRASA